MGFGKKLKQHTRGFIKGGLVLAGAGLAYLGTKHGGEVKGSVSRGIEDANALTDKTSDAVQNAIGNANVGGVAGGQLQRQAKQDLEELGVQKKIAVDRITNANLPSVEAQDRARAQQQALAKNRGGGQGGERGAIKGAMCVSECNRKHKVGSRKYKKCINSCK